VLTGRTNRPDQPWKPNYENQAITPNQNNHSTKDPFYKQTWFLVLKLYLFLLLSLIYGSKT
jgi:hypothetical protein